MTQLAREEPVSSRDVEIEDERMDARSGQPEWNEPGVETAIVLEVTAALVAHPPTELTVIEVNSRQGIVTLKGHVGSEQLHTMAGEIARRHPGVAATVNALEIREHSEPEGEVMM